MPSSILVKVCVKSRKRDSSTRWRQTQTYSETWHINTDMDSYNEDILSAIIPVWNYVVAERLKSENDVSIHYSLTLENTTAPSPPAGAWVQAKQHLDGNMTNDDLTSSSALSDKLQSTATFLIQRAQY